MAIYSYDRYTSTGQASFAITFDYLSSTHIKIYLDGVLQSTGYSIDTGTNQVTFTSAPGSGVVVLAQRVTPKTKADYQAQIADFANGSVLSESDLDNAVLGLLYISQEAEDSGNTNAISKDLADNLWDAESIRIKNVATPTGSADAVTKTYVDGLALYNSPSVPQLYSFTATASQTAFTLDPAPTSTDVQSFIVDLDGVVQKPTTDFTVSGSTLTLTTGASLAQVLTVRNIGVTRDILGDNPSTTGDLTVGDDLVVTDDASVGGDLTVTGAISGNVTSTGSTTARSLATRFAEVVNVKDYGAVGDGVTDDTAAIQAAVDAGTVIYFPTGIYVVDPTTGVEVKGGLTITGDGKCNSLLLSANTSAGSIIKRDFDTGGTNEYIKGVLVKDIGIVLNHVQPADPSNADQIGFDFRNITRSSIEGCYVGNYSKGALVGVRSDPSNQANARQGYGIVFGNVSSSDAAYAGGEVNRALNNVMQGLQKGVVLDDSALSPVSGVHASIVSNNDIQICESGITQESQYTAGCTFKDNAIQSIANMTGSTVDTYIYMVAGYNNYIGGGYVESTVATTDYLVRCTSLSKRNVIEPFYFNDTSHVITDEGKENVIEYIDPISTTDGKKMLKLDGFDRASGIAKAWCKFDSAGVILDSMNISSITNNGLGDWSISLPSGLFADSNYVVYVGGIPNTSGHVSATATRTQSTSVARIMTYNVNNAAYEDFDETDVIFFGE